MELVQAKTCGRNFGSPGVNCRCSACSPPKKIILRGTQVLFSESQEGACYTSDVEYDLMRIRDLEKAAAVWVRKLRIVSLNEFFFLSACPIASRKVCMESHPDQLSVAAEDMVQFPPLVGLGDGEEWVEFYDAEECSECEVRSVDEDEEWAFAGVSVNDRLKPATARLALDFKTALLQPPPESATARLPISPARRKPRKHVVLQAVWREDVIDDGFWDEEEEMEEQGCWVDGWEGRCWGRQVGAMRKSRSHVMVRMLAGVLDNKQRQRQRDC